MKTAFIVIGDEILYGHTVDSNSAFLGEHLTDLGYDPVKKEVIGDDIEMVESSISRLCKDHRLVIATGGLGPTHDDVTKKAVSRAFKRNLVLDDDVLQFLEMKYKQRGKEMPPSVQSQALIPQGSTALKNDWGTAPGILIKQNGTIFVSLPGVPFEMKNLFIHRLKPLLPEVRGQKTITFKRLKTSGIAEAEIFDRIKELLNSKEEVKLAFLPSPFGVDLRMTVKDRTRDEALSLMSDFEGRLRELIGDYIYGEGDTSMAEVVAELLKKKSKTLSTAESCTGGLLAKMLTDIPGSSAYLDRGVITYSNRAKTEVLEVPREMIEEYGAVSSEVATAMAEGIRKQSGTDYSLSITGIAGPDGGTGEKPVGTTYIGIASDNGSSARLFHFGNERDYNRHRAVITALNMLRAELRG
ncbi:MAG: competence/damage-inducible protein A [candidate division Zixibacteria bacterium]|nr:competence/damage-inducible protein A [candidate division Zixibacteria bacterium]